MATYFPFRPNGANIKVRDSHYICPLFFSNRITYQLENAFQSLNISYCELTSLLVLRSWTIPTNHNRINDKQTRRGPTTQTSETRLLAQTAAVSEYVSRLLKGEAVTSQMGRPLAPTAYIALLPTIWSLLNSPATQGQDQSSAGMLQIVVEHATKTSSKSVLKRLTTEFVARVILAGFTAMFIHWVLNMCFGSLRRSCSTRVTSRLAGDLKRRQSSRNGSTICHRRSGNSVRTTWLPLRYEGFHFLFQDFLPEPELHRRLFFASCYDYFNAGRHSYITRSV
jgi:hypothetical protein